MHMGTRVRNLALRRHIRNGTTPGYSDRLNCLQSVLPEPSGIQWHRTHARGALGTCEVVKRVA